MMKKSLVLAVALLFFCFLSFAGDLSFDFTVAGATKYLWRGQKLYDKFCIQPNLNIYLKNFTINYWASYPLDKGEYIESDWTFNATESMPYIDIVKLNAGFIIYTFPNNFEEFKNSLEIYGAISVETLLSPYLKLYYDPKLGNGYYLETGISHSFEFTPVSLNFYAITGYNFNQWGYSPSFSVLLFTPEIAMSLADSFSASVSTPLQIALNDQYENNYIINFSVKYVFN